jgi:L-aminopeptidase/D-esterase-like protein
MTGVTVIIPDKAAVAACDVRGGGPATRETDALSPENLVQEIDGVVLSGGSVYGMGAADGVAAWMLSL